MCNYCNYRVYLPSCSDVSPHFPECTACSSALKFDVLSNVAKKIIIFERFFGVNASEKVDSVMQFTLFNSSSENKQNDNGKFIF